MTSEYVMERFPRSTIGSFRSNHDDNAEDKVDLKILYLRISQYSKVILFITVTKLNLEHSNKSKIKI